MNITSVTFGLPVGALPEAAQWYLRVLGDRTELDPAQGVKEYELMPQFWLQLIEHQTRAVLRLGVDDIEQAHQHITHLGLQPDQIIDVPGAVRFFEFIDPYGNVLSFYQEYAATN